MRAAHGPLLIGLVAIGTPLAVLSCRDATKPPAVSTPASSAAQAQTTLSNATSSSATSVASAASDPRAAPPSIDVAPPADPPPPPPLEEPKAISAAACKTLLARSGAGFNAALKSIQRTCANDAECAQERTTCLPGCGGSAFSASDKDKLARATAGPNADCERFYAGLCTATLALPIPSCPQYLPVCEKGSCVSKMHVGRR